MFLYCTAVQPDFTPPVVVLCFPSRIHCVFSFLLQLFPAAATSGESHIMRKHSEKSGKCTTHRNGSVVAPTPSHCVANRYIDNDADEHRVTGGCRARETTSVHYTDSSNPLSQG